MDDIGQWTEKTPEIEEVIEWKKIESEGDLFWCGREDCCWFVFKGKNIRIEVELNKNFSFTLIEKAKQPVFGVSAKENWFYFVTVDWERGKSYKKKLKLPYSMFILGIMDLKWILFNSAQKSDELNVTALNLAGDGKEMVFGSKILLFKGHLLGFHRNYLVFTDRIVELTDSLAVFKEIELKERANHMKVREYLFISTDTAILRLNNSLEQAYSAGNRVILDFKLTEQGIETLEDDLNIRRNGEILAKSVEKPSILAVEGVKTSIFEVKLGQNWFYFNQNEIKFKHQLRVKRVKTLENLVIFLLSSEIYSVVKVFENSLIADFELEGCLIDAFFREDTLFYIKSNQNMNELTVLSTKKKTKRIDKSFSRITCYGEILLLVSVLGEIEVLLCSDQRRIVSLKRIVDPLPEVLRGVTKAEIGFVLEKCLSKELIEDKITFTLLFSRENTEINAFETKIRVSSPLFSVEIMLVDDIFEGDKTAFICE